MMKHQRLRMRKDGRNENEGLRMVMTPFALVKNERTHSGGSCRVGDKAQATEGAGVKGENHEAGRVLRDNHFAGGWWIPYRGSLDRASTLLLDNRAIELKGAQQIRWE